MTNSENGVKIAIVGIESRNVGNRLQNYALQQIIRDVVPDSTVITIKRKYPNAEKGCISRFRLVVSAIKQQVKRILGPTIITCFEQFDSNIDFSKWSLSTYVGPRESLLARSYSCFVIGSDQVWNPLFPFNSEVEYLPFVPAQKKIAYAASFGVSFIDANQDRTAELLNEIPHISMREDAGASIVGTLTNRTVPVVLDPTMLLSPSDWMSIERKPQISKIENEKYCLKYILGDDANDRAIREDCEERGLSIVDLTDWSLPVGPAEFVWLVHHSELVCTDSFHASVFSILFHRPFIVYERQGGGRCDMSSRFDTLFRLTGIGGHRFNNPDFSQTSVWECDWSICDTNIQLERARSIEWLRSSLSQLEKKRRLAK